MKKLLLLLPALFLMSACGTTAPVPGMIYADVKGPVAATHTKQGMVEGRSCATSYLGLIAMGDASITTAAMNGGIKKISAVDHHSSNILGIINEYCTIVYGHKGRKK